MKKKLYIFVLCVFITPLAFTQITGIVEDIVLASDDFEDDTPWVNYDQAEASVALNNAMGGEGNYTWSAWGGVAVNDGNSAAGGAKCLQAHWGGIVNIQGFEADPAEVYALELLVHPNSGNDGTWNNWAAIHLFTFDNTDVWQNQGFRIRFMNGGPGGNPDNLAVDYWEGEAGDYKIDFAYSWADDPASVYADGAVSPDFWIPVKIVFTGHGTAESPIKIDYYINNVLRKSSEYNNIVWTGDRMIGLSNNGNDGDVARFDNIKLTRMKKVVSETILASDDFEDDTPWVNYDQAEAPVALNNAMGGEGNYTWSAWGGVAVNDGNSAVGGAKCLQAHWGGIANIQGFEADPAEVYALELLVHPNSGNDGTWNNWAAIHLFTFDNTDVWQNQGFRIRFMNGGPGGNPDNLAVDYWEGEAGDFKIDFAYSWAEDPASVYVDGAVSPDFWIPVKIVFTGHGTAESPIKIDYYINNVLRKSSEYNNIVWTGDRMIGLSNNGNDGDVARFDNIKLTKLAAMPTGVEKRDAIEAAISVYPNPADIYVQIKLNGLHKQDLSYRLYDVTGKLLEKSAIHSDDQYINIEKYEPSLYYIQVLSGNAVVNTQKFIKR